MRHVTFVDNNDVTLLESGTAYFPALIAALDAAEHDVLFETYIFAEDPTGETVRDALVRAAQRGVKVRVLVDWIGTEHGPSQRLGAIFAEGGVHYRVFNPWCKRGIARSHRKIAVIDREVAFVGGINVNDDWLCDHAEHQRLAAPRWDFTVRVAGPLVDHIHDEAQGQWLRAGRLKLRQRIELFKEMRKEPRQTCEFPARAAFVVRDNLRNRSTIQRAYLQALGRAKHSVLLATPYFAPGRKFRKALAHAARRGVQVTLLIGVGEFQIQDAVAHSFYPKLLAEGINVVEYRKTQLHAKVAVVDDDWATVGSSNCDGLSLFLNQEANVVVLDERFAATMRAHIERGIADGVPVRAEEFAHIGWLRRASYGAAYMLYKLVMRIFAIGYA
ncbi:cardiolipin synthase ClsB [Massilia sp. G4R7]|uniref:Cardiolipin synthase B n=1 Tax=Massilia phyllostachyos TaxID=2898585 RepID=A0ABS8Q5S6_9BURK|nr:cardiolipin synthase ClsB [Massilia phyllostachyos]MCD2517091.1 cardiolipin synthase ClsB [Massilia phyllostachyos]